MKIIILIAACLFLFTPACADVVVGAVSIASPPVVTINSPVSGAWYSSNVVVNASIAGTTHAATYRWNNVSTNGAYVSMTSQGNNIWTKTFDTTVLADGNYTLQVNASNRFNMTGNKTVTFRVDNTLPVIILFSLTKTGKIYVGDALTASDFECNATDNSEDAGGSVTIVITGISTTTAGTKTATCTATDSANNTATAIVSYKVVSRGEEGAGGAGGVVVVGNESATTIIEQVPAGQTIRLTGFPAPIQYIEIETAQAISNSDITVSIIQSTDKISKAKVFIYFEVSSSISEDAIKSARIAFSVDKSWLSQKGLSADDVVLYLFTNGNWLKLSTTRESENGAAYTYVAETPGFSKFAIAANAPELLNAVTGAATLIPAVPLSMNMWILILMAIVLIVGIFFAKRSINCKKNACVKEPRRRYR